MHDTALQPRSTRAFSVGMATTSGFCSGLIGIGLARFAYTPLIPALVAEHWFTPGEAAYLGAANLAAYLAGAVLARHSLQVGSAAAILRANMLVATASFFACAWPMSFAWFFLWRFVAGFAGAVLMVLAAPTILPHVPPARRGLVSGIIFTGIGFGVIASGTLVPLLLRYGLTETWLGFGGIASVLTVVAWFGWPKESVRAETSAKSPTGNGDFSPALKALFVEYALNAAGMVPHMIFLVDFVARGLGQGLARGAIYWVLFGVGATLGPAAYGHLGDRIGFGPALRMAYVLQAIAVGALALSSNQAVLIFSSLIVGTFTPGIVPLTLGRMTELLPAGGGQIAAWSAATAAFALGQAAGAYGFSFLFAQSHDYALLYALGVLPFALALALDIGILVAARTSIART